MRDCVKAFVVSDLAVIFDKLPQVMSVEAFF